MTAKLRAATRLLTIAAESPYPNVVKLLAVWDAYVSNSKPNEKQAAKGLPNIVKHVSKKELSHLDAVISKMDDDTLWHAVAAITGGGAPGDGGLSKSDLAILWKMEHEQDSV